MLRALITSCAFFWAYGAQAEVTSAQLTQPTGRYDHAILGDADEWGGMRLTGPTGTVEVTLPQSRVFEDVTARVADLDGDGASEVLVVETHIAHGASLAVYDVTGRVTATPFIGRTHRWLAPLGVGDLDGDGLPEIAYVDRPHLARELVIVQYRDHKLTEIARISGLTNHRIGDKTIAGGIRNCGQGAEAILANADWSQVMAVRMEGRKLLPRALGPYSVAAMKQALACKL
ncbi:FG-GAP repeat domain-containing protein [Pseudorhodobacter sp. W20_MBD10_FR17]|uniref:FG-GAP repeat domain-containing protein n=1 Tax=Pseudorhodobacter sp. W20_MBD10_FR17 TaxID=3240266 RepID=UPI003F97C598